MTDAQKSLITRLTRESALTHEEILEEAENVAERPIRNLEDLSTSEASELIDSLQDGRI
jgi:hypothetical protein